MTLNSSALTTIKNKGLDNYDVVINAGFAGSAWSGGEQWKDEKVVSLLTEWVNNGGAFIGVNEPSATDGYDTFFRMSHVLGVSARHRCKNLSR